MSLDLMPRDFEARRAQEVRHKPAGHEQVFAPLHLLRFGSMPAQQAEHSPILDVLLKFREDLNKFIRADEASSSGLGFQPQEGSPTVKQLQGACEATIDQLESLSFGERSADLAPSDRLAASQLQEQVELFHAIMKDGLDKRDLGMVHHAIRLKSVISNVIHQIHSLDEDGGLPLVSHGAHAMEFAEEEP